VGWGGLGWAARSAPAQKPGILEGFGEGSGDSPHPLGLLLLLLLLLLLFVVVCWWVGGCGGGWGEGMRALGFSDFLFLYIKIIKNVESKYIKRRKKKKTERKDDQARMR